MYANAQLPSPLPPSTPYALQSHQSQAQPPLTFENSNRKRYNLGQAFGGLVTPALSELIGRRTPYLVSAALFSVCCLVTGLVPHMAAVWVGRFAAGFTSAVPAVVTAGSIHDMFDGGQRVWLVVVWNAGSTAGLCLGPLYGACLLAACGDWRWIFYVSAAVAAVCFACLLGVRESRPSQVLKRKIAVLRARGEVADLDWFNPDHAPDAEALVRLVLVQPLKLLGTEPIVIMVTAISAVSWGLIYLFTESLPEVYLSMSTGFTRTTASMAFLAFLPGVALSFLPRLWDRRAVRQGQRRGERIQPLVIPCWSKSFLENSTHYIAAKIKSWALPSPRPLWQSDLYGSPGRSPRWLPRSIGWSPRQHWC